MKWEIVIGLETHVQLSTASKIFSGSSTAVDAEPNTHTCATDLALPGTLPVMNRNAVHKAIQFGLAINAHVAEFSQFERKHYFYPDLPKNYQTSQLEHPIVSGGQISFMVGDELKTLNLTRAHLEEDAGKLSHFGDHSLVDLNRAGTPLIEIVSEPDIHSAAGARAYATELYRLMTYAGVTHGDLYHGNMRFDVNISVAKKGASELGKRAEVKNLNSFRSVERAAEYEFKRQIDLLESGQTVAQETRGWDDDKQITTSQRSKEDAQDYRYMPDADIPPVVLSDEEIASIQSEVPMLPAQYRESWDSLQLDKSVVNSLLANQNYARITTEIQKKSGDAPARRVAHWFASALVADGSGNDEDATPVDNTAPFVSIEDLTTLAKMTEDSEISSTNAKELFNELLSGAKDVRALAESKNMLQVSDEGAIATIVDEVLADPASAASIADYKAGKEKAIGYLVGQIMKKSQGKANPALAQKLIKERL